MANTEGDTFRGIRREWIRIPGAERSRISSGNHPDYPGGFPTWVHYATGTNIKKEDAAYQDRLKRILQSYNYGPIADDMCRSLWGRAAFGYTTFGAIMSTQLG